MKAIVAIVRAPHFSVRRPVSYQAAVALPLPQPSTIVGALAFSLSVKQGLGSGYSDSYVEECLKATLERLVRVAVKPLTPISRGALTLSRMRTLEIKSEEVEQKIRRGERISDAMIREYFYGRLGLIYVFKDDEDASKALEALYLVERLGDTESCVYICEVFEGRLEAVGRRGLIDTYTPRDWLEKILKGSFSLTLMCPEGLAIKVKRIGENLKEVMVEYVLPLYEEKENILYPTFYEAEVKEGFGIWRVISNDFEASLVIPSGE